MGAYGSGRRGRLQVPLAQVAAAAAAAGESAARLGKQKTGASRKYTVSHTFASQQSNNALTHTPVTAVMAVVTPGDKKRIFHVVRMGEGGGGGQNPMKITQPRGN